MDTTHPNQEDDSIGKKLEENPLDWMDILKILRDELKGYKVKNENIFRSQERQVEMNIVIL